jgi:hypothetical protein
LSLHAKAISFVSLRDGIICVYSDTQRPRRDDQGPAWQTATGSPVLQMENEPGFPGAAGSTGFRPAAVKIVSGNWYRDVPTRSASQLKTTLFD